MALYAASITKRTVWHGVAEEYDNVYHLEGPTFQAGDENFVRLLNRLADAEKKIHGENVTFVRGRIWSAGGTAVQNETLALVDFSGVGAKAGGACFKEAAVLVEWECNRTNVLGRKVYLRKYIRPGMLDGFNGTATYIGEAKLAAASMTEFKAYADAVQQPDDPTSLIVWALTSPSGRMPRSGKNGVVNDYLISREFRRN